MSTPPATLLPGSVLGLMGGGQLGRMTALAARSLGYQVHALDPDPHCPVRGVCDHFVQGEFDDAGAALELAKGVDVVTCEREDIGAESLRVLEQRSRLSPGRHALELVQDRGTQKQWLQREGFPLGPFALVSTMDELREALQVLGPHSRLKCRRGGFDGRGQWETKDQPLHELWERVGGHALVAEQDLSLRDELSVLVARSSQGETVVYPVAHNFHVDGTLQTSVMPAGLEPELLARACQLAERVAERLDVVGLLAVEMFWTQDGELLVNELAPRPHNSFHASEWACDTSQFEQLVRAVCGLPLGSVAVRSPTSIVNLYGELWLDERQGELVELLRWPGVHLRLYGKQPRPRRKLGHVACTAASSKEALDRATEVLRRLGSSGPMRCAS